MGERVLRFEPLAEERLELDPFVAEVKCGVAVRCLPEERCGLVGCDAAASEKQGFGQWRDERRTAVEV